MTEFKYNAFLEKFGVHEKSKSVQKGKEVKV